MFLEQVAGFSEQVAGLSEQVAGFGEQVTGSLGHYQASNVKQSISLMAHILLQYIELTRILNFNAV
jgi:hypothetical protein